MSRHRCAIGYSNGAEGPVRRTNDGCGSEGKENYHPISKTSGEMSRSIGRELNRKWNVGALHALYRKNGTWYHLLERFPGALFDERGYVIFDSKDAVKNCPGIITGQRANWLNVPAGIATLPGYVRVE